MPKATILIVEDEQVVALDLWRSLENCGYQVVGQADRGEAALRKAETLHPDLVLMDIGLKGEVDGIEAATQIRSRLQLPIIFLTAFSDEATVRRARPAEPYGYLLKPFDERELASNIEMALYKHGMDKKLRESEARFRGVIEHSADGMVLADHQGNLIEWNPAAERLTGLERSEVLGQPLLDVMLSLIPAESRTPGLQTALADQWSPALKSEPASPDQTAEFEIETPQDERRVIQTHGFRVETGEGALTGVSLRDTTERKRLDKALQASEERYRDIFENAVEGIYQSTPDGRFLSVNAALARIYGYTSPDEMIALVGNDIEHRLYVNPAQRVALRRRLEADGVVTAFDALEYRKDGSRIWTRMNARAVRDTSGKTLHYEGFLENVTERKRAEEALRQSEAFFNSIFYQSPYAMWIADETGTLVRINQTCCDLLNLIPDEVVGKYSILRDNLVEEQGFMPLVQSVFDRGETARFEIRYDSARLKNLALHHGAFVILGVTIFPIKDAQGKLSHAVIQHKDITDRKQAEMLIQAQKEQLVAQNEELVAQNEELASQSHALEAAEAELREMNCELEQRIQARSIQLRAANAELQQANAALLRAGRMKDEFLANMSHELRTPLTGILGLAEVLQMGIYGHLSEQQQQALCQVQASGEHLLQLINDILDLSKVEAGKMELYITPVLVDEVCQASLEFVKQTALNKNLRLSLRHDLQVHRAQADERRLKQMLINLLSNAVKFTPEGGQVGLEVAGDSIRQQVRLAVWDTGIGIPPEQQALLFQPFVQLDGSLARKYEGAGLGLALVRSMAELHGGSVTVESAGFGQGSRFTITLPWTPEPLPSTPTSADTAQASSRLVSLAALLGRPPVILAADDNPTTLMVLTSFLEALECQVITAPNGAEALAQAGAAQPDLILLDIHMPDLDGLTVVRRLRAAGSTVPVIALTALAMPGDRERCLAAGANDYLSKPTRLGQLAEVIQQWLTA
jgi:PAS domain S-box-containing protein